jgi:hypothetical protein
VYLTFIQKVFDLPEPTFGEFVAGFGDATGLAPEILAST